MRFKTVVLCLVLYLSAAAVHGAASAQFFVDDAGIFRVPQDYPTIQTAIDSAPDGARIAVAPGAYTENLFIDGKRLFLYSVEDRRTTRIHGNYAGPVFTISGPGAVVGIKGFFLTDGSDIVGAAVVARHAELSLFDNEIRNNETLRRGAQLHLESCDTLLARNYIGSPAATVIRSIGGRIFMFGNTVEGTSVATGTQLENMAEVKLIRNSFRESGTGLHLVSCEDAVVAGNVFYWNVQGARFEAGSCDIISNLVVRNQIGGIIIDNVSDANLWFNTFYRNLGDGLHIVSGQAQVFNSILASNLDGVGLRADEGSSLTADYNLYWNNEYGAYGGLAVAGEHDIEADPMFVRGPIDIHYLDPASPAIDAGTGALSQFCLPDDPGFSFGAFALDDCGVFRGEVCLDDFTTLVDETADNDPPDLGFHYAPQHPTPTPIPPAIPVQLDLHLSQSMFYPGDRLTLDLQLDNLTNWTLATETFLLLEVSGSFWFWPSWSLPPDSRLACLAPGAQTINVLDFTWPADSGAAAGIRFWSAVFEPSTYDLLSTIDMVEWGFAN